MRIKFFRLTRLLSTIACASLSVACGSDKNRTEPMQSVSIEWTAIGDKKIVFGHQSVGANILDGVRDLSRAASVQVSIQESRLAPTTPGITHFKVGQNGDAMSKIRDFTAAIDAGAAEGADVAAMKLCYLDFSATTDAVQVADAYIRMVNDLAARHPNTRFVAISAPLMVTQTGPKAWIKKIIGRPPAQLIENAKRGEFNERLRRQFDSDGRLFDLARLESSSTSTFKSKGTGVESLRPAYTSDGGHLNEDGRRFVASQFLNFVSTLR